MKYVYGLIILALSLSQFMAMARPGGVINPIARPGARSPVRDLMKEHGVTQVHPHYNYLAAVNRAVGDLRVDGLPACRSAAAQCAAFRSQSEQVFGVLANANQSVGVNHLAGTIAGKSPEIVREWEPSAQQGALTFLDGFTRTKGTVSNRVNIGTENLLKHLEDPAVMDPDAKWDAIDAKRRELEENCRLS